MFIWLLPTIGMLVNSFRPAADVSRTGWWTALSPTAQFTVENYAHVLAQNGLGQAFVNSLFITIPATIIPIAVASFAAYAFSWMTFPGRDVLFIVVVGLLVIPLQTTFVPILRLFRDLGIAGDFVTVWLAHTGYGLPFAIFLLRNYMGGLPREVFESAAIDGASPATAFFRLALPMSVPAIAALVIFQFLFIWNDLLVALVYLGASERAEPAVDGARRQPVELAGWRMALPDGGGVHHHGAPAHRLLRPPAVLRPRDHRRSREGLEPIRPLTSLEPPLAVEVLTGAAETPVES